MGRIESTMWVGLRPLQAEKISYALLRGLDFKRIAHAPTGWVKPLHGLDLDYGPMAGLQVSAGVKRDICTF